MSRTAYDVLADQGTKAALLLQLDSREEGFQPPATTILQPVKQMLLEAPQPLSRSSRSFDYPPLP